MSNEERVLGYVGNDPVVNTQHVLNATGPFGAIDALDPDARLRTLIETAQNFRRNNPDAPVRAAELAVNEVLRLRGRVTRLNDENSKAWVRVSRLDDEVKNLKWQLDMAAAELRWERLPWYKKIGPNIEAALFRFFVV